MEIFIPHIMNTFPQLLHFTDFLISNDLNIFSMGVFMELVISLLQKGLLEKALDLAISESFFNARSPDDIKKALKIGAMTLMLLTVTATMPFLPAEPWKPWIACSVMGINIHHINGHGQNALFHQKNPEILKKLIELGLDTSHTGY
ncbi:Uncharacterised protein [Kluyvera cryocrescens]|uniref:Uncharacterized protein n=1 Tax=Kluyvera cryocrescens TaxID=580 RepID=A0A485AWW0_KLUCR|nr:Uncharacterised protein [Kluyvera cryocrescens]